MQKLNINLLEEKTGYSLEASSVVKNGVDMPCLLVKGLDVSPVVFYPPFKDEYSEDFYYDLISDQIIHACKKAPEINLPDMDKDFILDRLVARVEHVSHASYLQDQDVYIVDPGRDIDLVMYFAFTVIENSEGTGSIKLTKKIMKHYDISEQDISYSTERNMLDDVYIKPLTNVLSEIMGSDDLPFPDENEPVVYVVTNRHKCNGAAEFLTPYVIDYLYDKFGGDYVILPSSIHEVLAMSAHNVNIDDLRNMVSQVNDTVVDPVEILSNNVYLHTDGGYQIA